MLVRRALCSLVDAVLGAALIIVIFLGGFVDHSFMRN